MPMYMPEKTQDDFKKTSEEFYHRTNFPNVIGAVDGKHIEITKPNQSGSLYYNYKNYFSIILMAICDANYCFTSIEVGAFGGSPDSNFFKNTSFYRQLQLGLINLPQPNTLPNDPNGRNMPFVLIGDEAFGLSEHVLRPYPSRNLTVQQRIYNYRLTRARRMIECSFGILSNKWRILTKAIELQPDRTISVVKACCILHNFVRIKDGFQFDDTLFDSPIQGLQPIGVRSNNTGLEIRDYFARYFTSPQGSIPWQYQVINRQYGD